MKIDLFSLRMRASRNGRHHSGAERIVGGDEIEATTATLMARAMNYSDGDAHEVHCSAERLDPATVHYERLPAVTTLLTADWQTGRRAASSLLCRAGVAPVVAAAAIHLLASGPGPGGTVMRGAIIMDAVSGNRLEPDAGRGIRVSRMDLAPPQRQIIVDKLTIAGLKHHRVREALVLAGKVLSAPGVVAELCWSDDPTYSTGYVSDPKYGYQRITNLKPSGDPSGGRVFFVAPAVSLPELIDYLERQPVLFDALGPISPPQKLESDNA